MIMIEDADLFAACMAYMDVCDFPTFDTEQEATIAMASSPDGGFVRPVRPRISEPNTSSSGSSDDKKSR
jgi:hypothetical protein